MSKKIGLPTLYIDNFRGFEDTYIPLKQVNFFVGENSTGKTSILSLINLLYSTPFWFQHVFNNSDVHLGSFYEIANKNNSKKYFEIGFFNHMNDFETNQMKYDAVLLKFYNNRGIPAILECSYSSNNQSVISKIAKNNKSIQYKIINNDDLSDYSDPLEIFKQWVEKINIEIVKIGFHVIKIDYEFPCSVSVIQNIIENNVSRKSKKGDERLIISTIQDNFMGSGVANPMGHLSWIAPIRAKPERTFDDFSVRPSPRGEHIPYILKDILASAKKTDSREKVKTLIQTFGLNSGLFDSIKIKKYGRDLSSPFEIDIVLNSSDFKITNIGYGVSQVLPIIVDILYRDENTVFAIQQPEIHLHPKAQAALGDFIYSSNLNENKNFFIETHSEYLIDRFRFNVHKNKEKDSNSQVLFFERTANGNTVHMIEIEDTGRYSENQPSSFTDFFINEDINLLEI